jgi:hypothetical protein
MYIQRIQGLCQFQLLPQQQCSHLNGRMLDRRQAMATNEHAALELLDAPFSMLSVSYHRKMGD